MARENNFLLGNGDRLTEPVTVPSGGGDKNPPYTFASARSRISGKLAVAQSQLASLPEAACPRGEVVAVVTLHPRYLAKSDFPTDLLSAVGLRSVGSRSRAITPENWGISKHPETAVATTDLFVAGSKSAFQTWAGRLPRWTSQTPGASQLVRIEDVAAFQAQDKIRAVPMDRDEAWLEVVIHNGHDSSVIEAFEAYARSMGAEPLMNRRRDAGGLTFIPVRFSTDRIEHLAQFSFLRIVRGMPSLRPLQPSIMRQVSGFQAVLPSGDSLDANIRIAVFDGGIPGNSDLTRWVQQVDPPGIGNPVPAYQAHGLAVTSALLFGPLLPQTTADRPYCIVDHIRVLDERSGADETDLEILDVLDRILTVLDADQNRYQYANISLGPDLATTDDEVTAWTASLDERFAQEDFLVTVAVGNNGHLDHVAGLNRVQPPGDGVNVLSVGASTSPGSTWQRAPYSCIGPGRCPGVVKPDGLAFGGSATEPFYALAPGDVMSTIGYQGTSFASPLVLRSAVGVRAYLGDRVTPLVIRALLIHRAQDAGYDRTEVGWGRFETDVESLVTCEDDEVLVLFQGKLPLNEHLRAQVPVPDGELAGMVTITATLVIAPQTDPEHPAAYTRSGLEVAFRPNDKSYHHYADGKVSKHPRTWPFFSQANMHGAGEYVLRGEGHKWEPCLRCSRRLRASSLSKPCFDIYYHSREAAVAASDAQPIPYALIVSMKAPRVLDLYNRVVRTYANILVPLRPVIRIPVQVTG